MFLRRLVSNLLGAVYDAVWPPEEAPVDHGERKTEEPEVGAPLQEHIDSGAIDLDAYDYLTRGAPNEPPSMPWRPVPSDDEHDKANAAQWDHVLLIGNHRDDRHLVEPGPLFHLVEAGDLLVDAAGEPVARVKEGPVQVYLGTRAFVTVEWLTDDGLARMVSRLDKANWVSAKRAPWVSSRQVDPRERVGWAILGQIQADERNGLLRPEFASALRAAIGYQVVRQGEEDFEVFDGAASAAFFVDHIVKKNRPPEPIWVAKDGEPNDEDDKRNMR